MKILKFNFNLESITFGNLILFCCPIKKVNLGDRHDGSWRCTMTYLYVSSHERHSSTCWRGHQTRKSLWTCQFEIYFKPMSWTRTKEQSRLNSRSRYKLSKSSDLSIIRSGKFLISSKSLVTKLSLCSLCFRCRIKKFSTVEQFWRKKTIFIDWLGPKIVKPWGNFSFTSKSQNVA